MDKWEIEKQKEVNQLREDLFITCVEGGSNYWAIFEYIPKADRTSSWSEWLWEYIKEGGRVMVFDGEDYDINEPLGYIDMKKVYEGEKLMRQQEPEHYANMINERWDAETADVWLQFIVLGEITFG